MEVVEILPLEYEPAPAGSVERLAAQQAAERDAKNRAALTAWHRRHFGDVAGGLLAAEWQRKVLPC